MSPHELFYNIVKNITYKGTQAENTTMIYNNVENINKEAVELNNSYYSKGKSMGLGAGVNMSLSPDMNKGMKVPNDKFNANSITGSVNISTSKYNSNTDETIYQNGSFKNINEVHNNTKNMKLKGFNQEGGKVTGKIENLELISVQNISTTRGNSSGGSVGIPLGTGTPSINVNGSVTKGDRAFVDNQTTFIVGEESDLKIGTTTNMAGILGTEEDGKIHTDKYVGKDLINNEKLKTVGGSLGTGGAGVKYNNEVKEGITRNTIIGNVTTDITEGTPINRDITKANEITGSHSTNTDIYAESQLIGAIVNPGKFKEKQAKALQEIKDIGNAILNSINEKGGDNRNFIDLLNEQRRGTAMKNLLGADLSGLNNSYKNGMIGAEEYQKGLEKVVENFGKDIGINIDLVFADTQNMPKDSKNNEGAAYVDVKNKTMTIPINVDNISSTSELIGTVFEEVSHVLDGVSGRQKENDKTRERGEKGLESLGRPINDYFSKEYENEDSQINLKDQGIDLTNAELGNKVGDVAPIVAAGATYITFTASQPDFQLDLITLNDDLEEFKNNPSLKTGAIVTIDVVATFAPGLGATAIKKAGKWVVRGGKAIFIAADGQIYKATGKGAAEFISQISKTKIAKKGISVVDDVTKSIVKHTDNLKKKSGEVGNKIVKGWENLIGGGNTSRVAKQLSGLGVETKIVKLGVNIDGTVATGKAIDKALGNNLGETFKTFDRFENGVATSIKSMNLNAKSYQSGTNMLNTMKRAINEAADFTGDTLNKVNLQSKNIKTRIVNFVVNDINLNQSQMDNLKKAIDYGKQKGIKIQITVVK